MSNRKWSLEQMKAITSAREGNVEAATGGSLKAEEILGLLVKLGSFEKLTLPAPATQTLVGAEEGKEERKKETQKEESESESESSDDDDARRRRNERQKKNRDRDWKKDNKSRDWQRRDGPFRCYYCDEESHTLTRCPTLEKELEEGIVKKNVNGHICDANWNKVDFRVKGGMRAVILEKAKANKDKKKKARVNVVTFDDMLPPEIVARDDNPGSQNLNVSHISQREVAEKKREKAQRELDQLIDGTKDLVKEGKGKEVAGKKRKVVLRSEAEEGISIDEVVKKLFEETEITLSWKEAVALVPKFREELKKMVERRKVEINSLRLFPQHVERAPPRTKMRFGNMSCAYLNISVNDVRVRALVDSGAEMVLTSSATMRSCGFGTDRKVNHQLSNIAGFLPLEGFIDDLPIRIGTLRVEILSFVVPNLDHDCILGAPFLHRMEVCAFFGHDGAAWLSLQDPVTGQEQDFVISDRHHPRHQRHVNSLKHEESEKLIEEVRAKLKESGIIDEKTMIRVNDIGKMLKLLDEEKKLGDKREMEGFKEAVRVAKAGTMQLTFSATGPFLGK
ncbi:hypothetical protein CBR_g52425 [Chara braunii]|uniref:Uncharacterized protein n=1 Tax=Chara braunii TaxID=69332 RepID=A0A388MAJ1_CHABU|nr:hypothetical protein CBR_g52425 [Chara braunii]|eukprot:GBG91469.1 hypothetical protein CBR_g52425 [Chara braunii]